MKTLFYNIVVHYKVHSSAQFEIILTNCVINMAII